MTSPEFTYPEGSAAFPHRGLVGIAGLAPHEIMFLLDEAQQWVELNRHAQKRRDLLSGLTIINAFFENSTRTLLSFEIAGKRLGADVVNMAVATSSVKKGETLIDTAMTLNAMRADAIAIRHGSSGAVQLIADKVDCPVINAGDGQHEHPTQALLDALTIRQAKRAFNGLRVTICGDILHSRVARSNILCLTSLGAEVRVCAPPALMPADIERMNVQVFHDFDAALQNADVVMMLRLQLERMQGQFIPSPREYRHLYGLSLERLAKAESNALVMHPGPMNRGIEIDSNVADLVDRSMITTQVEMGVAIRMACLDVLTRKARGLEGWA
ncbi:MULTISPECIES: aspartate carbamoyltransferase catalytic subunit [unclassified Novosphingobium]|uniref:aspartate carbamoyltransferase catalytic subunit n=1 Tax=unclassified Novosphingobium TaxID=2644732 RepID=UPI00020EF508|nr:MULTISPECIES: aspartate carbamoyltransferase catalytic subunit [unclassified Novosphingobium]GFM29983.1 aspartate carbamoyltransferase [Novosphingobium sp. PY1]CCA92741.1 aspartate carbamoyltransferase catalytic subunit [Novosphingobium sp. PP1Y]